MKKTLGALSCIFLINSVYAVNFAGTYNCTGYDSKDGKLKSKFIIVLDKKHSKPSIDQFSYTFKSLGIPTLYIGSAISKGNNLALNFQNIKDRTSHDDGIALVTANLTKDGKIKFIDKVYYETSYISTGQEKCEPISNDK